MFIKHGINIVYTENESDNTKKSLISRVSFDSDELNYPVKIFFTSQSGNVIWSTLISHSNTWCELPSSRNIDIRVIDNNGEIILNKIWSENFNSDICELKFLDWCKYFISTNNKKPKGIVVGAHNGSSGEWVTANNKKLIGSTLLIEPNETPFQQLVTRYQNDFIFTYKNILVSETGGHVDFYTDKNGESESSSILQSNVTKYHDKIITKKIYSKTLNDLIIYFEPDWIHLDVEGLDAKLLLSVSDELIQKIKFIIWEDIHLTNEETILLNNKLKNNGFTVLSGYEYNSFAFKN
jgi:FkbM family methyltransferase